MVRAGEAGGILDKVLDRLAYQQEKDAALKGKIKAAMIYPIVIFSVTMIAFVILMTFIVPKIAAIITSLSHGKSDLPIYTQILLSVSNTMQQPAFIIGMLVGLPTAIIFFRRYIKTPKGRYQWHSLLLRIPAIKVIITKTAIARFSRIFASLMGAGVSIVDAINTTAGAIGNAVIEQELLACAKAIQAGNQLSTQLEKSKHFPPIVSQMLAVGEETGQTDTVILKVAEFYEEEVDAAVGALSSIVEPVMIIVLGGMVGLIALSVFGPITQISSSVQ
jgi:type IV pilus assembly protein PilC